MKTEQIIAIAGLAGLAAWQTARNLSDGAEI